MKTNLPRVLVIDDLFGRVLKDGPNKERANLCGMYGLRDISGNETTPPDEEVVNPVADAVFSRGQTPLCAKVGDAVENDLAGIVEFVRKGWSSPAPQKRCWSLVLLDLCFYTGAVTEESYRRQPGMPEGRPGDDDPRQYFGLRILERLHAEFPDLPVVILSSKPRDDVSQSFVVHGALGFIPRTDSSGPEKLKDYLWRHGLIEDETAEMVGCSKPLLLALRAARRAAADRRNVLIRGERGAGKELIASYMNRLGAQGGASRSLIAVDSGSLSPTLFASELFGHVKGAYTGAQQDRQGRIVQADGGDLFLDEIGNMPLDVQTGLLRVLETKLVIPVGASSGRAVNVRFIAATNEDIELKAAVGGGFRADLLDRLREGGTIILPPLRERREDIPLLAQIFVRQAEKDRPGALKRTITPEALDKLVDYSWPGNIRELRNCIRKAVSDHPDVEHVVPDHLRIEASSTTGPVLRTASAAIHYSDPISISTLLQSMKRVQFDFHNVGQWMGHLHTLQHEQTRVAARLLGAALEATKRRTPEHPDGLIQIHPAAKLATGDTTLTASKAADLFKRTLGPIADELEGDLVLAYRTALRLRPKAPPRSTGSNT